MKKFIALALTLALALCVLAIPTFAAPADNTHEVEVTVNSGSAQDIVYRVDVVWDALDFTYNFNSEGVEWDPATHAYKTAGDGAVGAWNKTSANITVTNHSNAAVNVSATKADVANTGVTFELTNASFELATAEGTTFAAAPTQNIVCAVSGVPTSKTGFLATTITIAFN